MAKDLPFFKFNPGEWLTGNISYESFEIQGAFIKICAEYWNRENKLTMQDAGVRLNNNELLKKLIEKGYLKLKSGKIIISFLDEERNSLTSNRLKLIESGRKGGLSSAQARLKRGSSIKKKNKIKDKEEEKEGVPAFDDFLKYALEEKPLVDHEALSRKYKTWVSNGWKDGNDKPIKNWKTKLINTLPYIPTAAAVDLRKEITPDVWRVARQIPAELDRLCKKFSITPDQFNALHVS